MLSFFKKNKKNLNNELKILSGYNFRYRKVGQQSEENIIKYANFFNFDYEINKTNKFERHFFWLKIQMLIDNLENASHKFYLWLDADTFFCRYENILNHIDKTKHIYINRHLYNSKHKTNYKNVHYVTVGVNTGVLLVRNTKWSLNFLKSVWNKKKYLNHYWGDNAAFMDVMGYKAELSFLENNRSSKKILNKFQFLSGLWNSMPRNDYEKPKDNLISYYYFNPIIIHLAGIRRRERLKFLKNHKHLLI